jgi:hypothetical protein
VERQVEEEGCALAGAAPEAQVVVLVTGNADLPKVTEAVY